MNIPEKLAELIAHIDQLPIGDYSTPLACGKIIFDTTIIDAIEHLYAQLDAQTVTDVLLVGIGGSHFGVQAIYDALYADSYSKPPVAFHALTSIDSFTLSHFESWYSALLQNANRRLFTFVVSKTGATLETASHASLCFELLKKHQPAEYRKNLCIITDESSPLWQAAKQEDIPVLTIPKNIGGRYSVFSAAGLGVLRFLKINFLELLRGAQSVSLDEPTQTAQQLFDYLNRGYLVHDTFIFMPHYAGVGGWVRQLIGESLGKEGKGFLPTVSLGSQDLHSVVQCYFAGPQIAVTTFIVPPTITPHTAHDCDKVSPHRHPECFSQKNVSKGPQVPHNFFSTCGSLSPSISFGAIQQAIVQGVQASYTHANKPYFTFELAKDSAYDIGRFMQYKMLETVYLGTLMDINPFDQPQVELYKIETRKLLS
jgi:glucose-6-phosphate isomerase